MSNFNVDFTGKTVLITGAGAGIGKAIARAFAQAGANVALNDLNPDRVETLSEDLQSAGHDVAGFQGDISNRFQASACIERARDAFGKIDFLINAAGIFKSEPMLKTDEWDIRRQIEVNAIGTFFMVQLMSRVMADEGGGVIVNIASTAGHPHPIAQGAGYVMGKVGIIGLTKQAAIELAQDQVRVNAICPANVDEDDMPVPDVPANALGRVGTPDEIAQVALFLCSDGATFITGQAINVDGGESFV
jgi:3-oxoacyl-[acyl-carrier protein] reductase